MIKFFHGDNTFASWNALQELLLNTKGGYKSIAGDELDNVQEIFVALDSLHMFTAAPEITVIKRIYNNRKRSLVNELLAQLQRRSVKELQLLIWEDKKISSGGKLLSFLQDLAAVQEFKPFDIRKLRSWVLEYAKSLGVKISPDQAVRIIHLAGSNQFLLASEIQKLALLLKSENRNTISASDLNFISVNSDADIWKFLNAVAARNRSKILENFHELVTQGNDVQYLIAMLARHLKTLFIAVQHPYLDTKTLAELGINQFFFRRTAYFAKKFTIRQIKLLFSKLTNLDFGIKQGKIDPMLGANLFLATI